MKFNYIINNSIESPPELLTFYFKYVILKAHCIHDGISIPLRGLATPTPFYLSPR